MYRQKLIVGNWKMNKTTADAAALLRVGLVLLLVAAFWRAPARAGTRTGPPWPAPGPAQVAAGVRAAGLPMLAIPGQVVRFAVHLDVLVDGRRVTVPAGIGIDTPGHRVAPLYTADTLGIIHVAADSDENVFTLGQFFAEWGIPLSSTQVGPAQGKVTVFFTSPGKQPALYTGNPRDLPLGDHYQIQLVVGTPIVAPYQVTNWGGL